jgi:hypothetical protein
MDTSFFDAAQVAIVPQSMIAAASGELVAIYGDEEPIVGLSLSVLQVLMEYLHDVLIQGDYERLSVLRDIHIDDAIVEVQIPDFDVYQAVLADASRQKQIDNDPTAIVGEVTSPHIGLPQQSLEFCIGVGFDVVLVRLRDGDFKVGDVLAAHEEPQNGLQISCVSSKRNVVDVGVFPQSDDELRHRLFRQFGDGCVCGNTLVDLLDCNFVMDDCTLAQVAGFAIQNELLEALFEGFLDTCTQAHFLLSCHGLTLRSASKKQRIQDACH